MGRLRVFQNTTRVRDVLNEEWSHFRELSLQKEIQLLRVSFRPLWLLTKTGSEGELPAYPGVGSLLTCHILS